MFQVPLWCRHWGNMIQQYLRCPYDQLATFAQVVQELLHLRQVRGMCDTYPVEWFGCATECPPKYEVRRCGLMTEVLCRCSRKGLDSDNLMEAAHKHPTNIMTYFKTQGRHTYAWVIKTRKIWPPQNTLRIHNRIDNNGYSHRKYIVDLYSNDMNWS